MCVYVAYYIVPASIFAVAILVIACKFNPNMELCK